MYGQGGSVASTRECLLDGCLCPEQERGFRQRIARVVRPRVPAGGQRRRGARPRVRVGGGRIRFSVRSGSAGLQPLAPQRLVEGGVQARAVVGPGSGVARRRLLRRCRCHYRSRRRRRLRRRRLVVESPPPRQQLREDIRHHERHDLLAELTHARRFFAGRYAVLPALELFQRQHQQLVEQIARRLPAEPWHRLTAVAVELRYPRREHRGRLSTHGRIDEPDEELKRRGVALVRFRRSDGGAEALEALLGLRDGVADDGH